MITLNQLKPVANQPKVAAAATNGGSLGRVHAEFKDGYVFTIRKGEDYIPVVFDFYDIFDCPHKAVIATGDLYHNRLMRRDGGWRRKTKKTIPLFDWHEMKKVKLDEDFCCKDAKDRNVFGFQLNRAKNAAVCDLEVNHVEEYRCDSTYWRIDKTIQNDSSYTLFGFSQEDPRLCCEDNCKEPCSEDNWFIRTGCTKEDADCLIVRFEKGEQ